VYVNRYFVDGRASAGEIPIDRSPFHSYRYRPMMRGGAQVIAFAQMRNSVVGATKLTGALDYSFEDRFDVGR
jgi:hypothetical protein